MDTYQAISLAGGAGLSVLLFFTGVLSLIQRRRPTVSRLENYVRQEPMPQDAADRLSGPIRSINRWLSKRSFGASVANTLAQADIKLTVTEFMLLHLAMAAAGLILGPIILGSAVGGLILAVPLLLLPKLYVSSARSKRLSAFNQQLPAALNSISNSLRGGYGLLQAMKLVAAEMSPPIATEFQRVVSEVSYGLAYDVAFGNMLRRNTSPDLSLVVTAIEINIEVGGNLAEILDNISGIIRDRVRLQAQVKAYTAQVRFSALVLSLLPFGLGGVIFMLNRPYMSQLWQSQIGLIMMGVAIVLIGMASMMLQKIATIDV
jgi:tight adherence protein B